MGRLHCVPICCWMNSNYDPFVRPNHRCSAQQSSALAVQPFAHTKTIVIDGRFWRESARK